MSSPYRDPEPVPPTRTIQDVLREIAEANALHTQLSERSLALRDELELVCDQCVQARQAVIGLEQELLMRARGEL
jgi:hypothetical protein